MPPAHSPHSPDRPHHIRRLLGAALLLSACALRPLEPDRAARAPVLDGFGMVELAISSRSPAARQWFARGMAQAHAFNEIEAVRAFKAGLAQDPACAMCAWGVAYQLGPTLNAPERGDLSEARRYLDHALRHGAGLLPRERELIEAMALRYAHDSQARNTAPLQAARCGSGGGSAGQADPLDGAYAERLRRLVERDPDDPDLLTLYAEAELIATREDWWDPLTGKPAGRIGELAERLEAALLRHPRHTGLNHYLIHTVDALPVAGRAAAAADRLGALAPRSPHLLHMPSHIYVQLGRYADATRVNQQALAADVALVAEQRAQGFEPSKDWREHNGRFQWYAALMEGRGDLALETARAGAARAGADAQAFGQYQRSLPIQTLLRLERWAAVLAEPPPKPDEGLALVLDAAARGTALARLGQGAAAAAQLARLQPQAALLLGQHAGPGPRQELLRGLVEVAQARLRAELALAAQRFDEALAQQALAVAVARGIDNTEPPMLAAGARLALGDMQLRAQHWAAAEQSFRTDLAEHPASGWALRGLGRALRAQGRRAEAEAQQALLAQAWRVADAGLRTAP